MISLFNRNGHLDSLQCKACLGITISGIAFSTILVTIAAVAAATNLSGNVLGGTAVGVVSIVLFYNLICGWKQNGGVVRNIVFQERNRLCEAIAAVVVSIAVIVLAALAMKGILLKTIAAYGILGITGAIYLPSVVYGIKKLSADQ